MGIINDVKDTARKATNAVVDGAENMVGIPKSPKELAKRVIEHLMHQEYKEVATMLSDEAKKYLDKMGIADNALVKSKLANFDNTVNSLAIDLENHNYEQVAVQFEGLQNALPTALVEAYPILGSVKTILGNISDNVKKTMKDGVEPKFEDMLEGLETSFKDFTK